MIRVLTLALLVAVVYYVLKTVLRSAVRGYQDEDRQRSRLRGEEMVLDPECRTYVLKDRAISRRIDGKIHSFCSENCAKRYEEKSGA